MPTNLSAAERTIAEKSTHVYRTRIQDQNGAAILLANVAALTLTCYRAGAVTEIINSRTAQNVLNANNVTYASGSGTITAASNAAPIVVTSATHGRATGDWLYVSTVLGNAAANGLWKITKVDANSFELDGSVGDGTYASGGTWDYSLLEWELQTLDNAIVGTGAVGTLEEHVALFRMTYATTKILNWEFRTFIENLGVVT